MVVLLIRPFAFERVAQCVCVTKKNGTLRLCQDCRKLNMLMKTDSGGLGDSQSIFDRLHGSTFFTTIDLASGFLEIEIAEQEK